MRLERFIWYLNGAKLSAKKSERLKIDTIEPDLTGTWTSELTFNPASPKDSGRLYIQVTPAAAAAAAATTTTTTTTTTTLVE